ncbi:unnamed protein product [Phytophthora fragariaefolia]|uniref:Unnamed protein product n=1 Tax=Phytophthora fragariaefolia TaxID=1490495 RepID=A0A9W7D344_9STRA|nr:unnamed protein product [Phytophthora fragariaefolia]
MSLSNPRPVKRPKKSSKSTPSLGYSNATTGIATYGGASDYKGARAVAFEYPRWVFVSHVLTRSTTNVCIMLIDSSEVYTDEQLDDMKRSGWEVLPVNTVAEVTNDAAVDKMYDGYCGPSKAIMTALRSPLKVFYYFLPKPIWRKVPAQTNL